MGELKLKKEGGRTLKKDKTVKEFVELASDDYYWIASFVPRTKYNTEKLKSIGMHIRTRQISMDKRGKLSAKLY
jgi:hypothetical protein